MGGACQGPLGERDRQCSELSPPPQSLLPIQGQTGPCLLRRVWISADRPHGPMAVQR